MILSDEKKQLGFFKGLPYFDDSNAGSDFEEYARFANHLDRLKVVKHIEELDTGYSSIHTRDLFTGADLGNAGIIEDGPFIFPVDFLYYYRRGMIGLPPEYEQYLVETMGL